MSDLKTESQDLQQEENALIALRKEKLAAERAKGNAFPNDFRRDSYCNDLQKQYADRGFTVLGFPCNQFLGQEPGTAEEIKEFCSTTYGVTFPLMEKTRVNGWHKHPLYAQLTQVPDADGHAGRVKWNFEKFLIAPDGTVSRFRPSTQPDDPAVIEAIEQALPA